MSSVDTAVEYYSRRFGGDINSAFIHLVREVGEIAFAIEKGNAEHAKVEIAESIALLHYMARLYNMDVDASIERIYSRKLEALKQST
ncbi:MAG: hypothetical protein RMJ59_01730 [Candidatus Nitrosocaldus sp.]|nr:hypothetical protein [Candidatus Nitrosocaldus sp.]MCS7140687.1 hypothetical protein [Candidatus Nitrosocaldus sp.]MDW7999498.1 hypothetical protein [Candidatus Nitrosocaldus sp.]MDW8275086.1 hypothetical protein [Candidatus Nitrosocaldus sp.]